MKLRLIRSATLVLQYSGIRILIDPYFAEKFSRPSFTGKSLNPLVSLPCSLPEIMHNIDIVLVSHLHSDHFDPVAQNFIPKTTPILCQAEDEKEIRAMGFVDVRSITDTYQIHNILIKRVIGKHGKGGVLKEMGMASGFVFCAEGEPDLFWMGDTILYKKMKETLLSVKPKVVVTHSCGAVWGNNVKIVMDELQTIEVCKMLPSSAVIATHLDSLDHGTVTRKQLRKFADKNGIGPEQLIIPEDGEEISFSRILNL